MQDNTDVNEASLDAAEVVSQPADSHDVTGSDAETKTESFVNPRLLEDDVISVVNLQAPNTPSENTPLVLGILSIVLTGIIGIVLGIFGIKYSNDALRVIPDSGKAKAGRICSIVGIVLSAASTIAVIIMFAFLGIGLSIFGGELGAVNKVATQTLDGITNPSDSERLEIAEHFDSEFETRSGLSLSDLGVDYGTFSAWLFEDTSYKITDTKIEGENGSETATVTADVTAHSFRVLSDVLGQKISSMDSGRFSTATSSEELYSIIGAAVSEAMADTPTTTKSVELKFSKVNDKWTLNEGFDQALAYEIYAN